MKKLLISVLAIASLTMTGLVYADGKIVVFNIQAAILQTEAAQTRLKEFQEKAEIAEMRAKYESIAAEMQKMDQDAKTNSVTWTQEQKEKYATQMEYKRAELEVEAKKLQNESQTIQVAIIREMEQKARDVLQELIKSEGIGLALNANAVQYADTSYDITSKITDRLNKAK